MAVWARSLKGRERVYIIILREGITSAANYKVTNLLYIGSELCIIFTVPLTKHEIKKKTPMYIGV